MSYESILLHLEIDGSASKRLQFATALAGDLDAYLIGFAGVATRPVHASELGPAAYNAYSEALASENLAMISELKREFFRVAGDGCKSGWRECDGLPTDGLIETARIADLVVSGTPYGADAGDIYRSVDPGELARKAGRPVLFVAEDGDYRHPECALIGWTNTPEARRAVFFALPFLRLADRCLVITLQDEGRNRDTGGQDVVRYLIRHGIDADARTVTDRRGPDGFLDVLDREGADLVVSGAYGHSRMRERIFGGFTQALLMRNDLNRLMAG